jgi:hypothetical protein
MEPVKVVITDFLISCSSLLAHSVLLKKKPSREANGFIFLYDVSLRHTFAAFERWREVRLMVGASNRPHASQFASSAVKITIPNSTQDYL